MEGFLQEGNLVELDFEKSTGEVMKFKSLVESVSSDELMSVYAPIYRGKTYPLTIGDILKVFYSVLNKTTGKYEIFSFSAHIVSRIRKENIALIRIKRTTPVIQVQRRDTYRLSFVKKMALTLIENGSERTVEILSKDISVGGMRGIVQQPFEPGQEVICHLFLSDNESLDFQGVVLSSHLMEDSRLKYEARIQFEKINPETMKKLVKFINKAQADMIKKVSSGKHERLMQQTMGLDSDFIESVRRGPDFISNWINYAPLLLWLMFAASILLFISGMPATEYPLQRFFNFIYRRGWNFALLQNSLAVTSVTFVISVGSLILNRIRLRRNYDRFRMTYFIVTILSLLMFIVTLVMINTQA